MSESDAKQPVLSYYAPYAPPRFDDPAGEGEVVIRAAAPPASAGVVWLSLGLAGVIIVTVLLVLVGIGVGGDAGFGIGNVMFLLVVVLVAGVAGGALVLAIRRRLRYGELPVTFRVDREGRLTVFNPGNWGLRGRRWEADEVEQIAGGPVRRALSGGHWFELRLWLVTLNQVGISLAAEDREHPQRLAEALRVAMEARRGRGMVGKAGG